jgi:hypothetical protein
MAKNHAKRRAERRRRARVERAERVMPTPETLAKLRPWTMAELLRLGPDLGGIDPMQHEAAVEIVDAFKALTKELGFRPLDLERVGRGTVEMGPRELRLATIYLAWAARYQRRFLVRPHVVVEWIEDERRLDVGAMPLLRGALNLWDTIRGDIDRAKSAQRQRHTIIGAPESEVARRNNV